VISGRSVALSAGCGRTLQEPQGSFGSYEAGGGGGGGGSSAGRGRDQGETELCQWRVQATHGEKIVLNVTTLDLPDSADCAASYVEVRDGPSVKSPLIGQPPASLSVSEIIIIFFLTLGRYVPEGV